MCLKTQTILSMATTDKYTLLKNAVNDIYESIKLAHPRAQGVLTLQDCSQLKTCFTILTKTIYGFADGSITSVEQNDINAVQIFATCCNAQNNKGVFSFDISAHLFEQLSLLSNWIEANKQTKPKQTIQKEA